MRRIRTSRLAAAARMAARCLPVAARAGWRGDIAWTVALSPSAAARLAVLAAGNPGLCLRDVGDVLAVLADHADQGVYRSGSWERGWLCSAFGHDWTEVMEPDPDGRAPSRQRPRRGPLDAHPDNWGPVPPAPGHWP